MFAPFTSFVMAQASAYIRSTSEKRMARKLFDLPSLCPILSALVAFTKYAVYFFSRNIPSPWLKDGAPPLILPLLPSQRSSIERLPPYHFSFFTTSPKASGLKNRLAYIRLSYFVSEPAGRSSLTNSPTAKLEGINFAQPPPATGPINWGRELPRLIPLSLPHVNSPSLLYCNSNTDSSLFSFAVVKFSAKFSIKS